jgi:hypothetical protein
VKKVASFFVLVGCAAGAPAWSASLNPTLDDRVSIRGGPFFASIDSSLAIQGQDFSVEDRLDDSKTTFAIALDWRITSRLILTGNFSQVSRDETFGAGTPIGIGGVTIPAGASAELDFTTRQFGVNLGYSVVRNRTTEFGAAVGIKVLTIEDKVAFTPGGGPTVVLVDDDTTQPLPVLGLYLNHAFSRSWMITGRASYFDFDVGDIDGKVVDLFGGVEWRPWQSVGLGLAYAYTDADVTITDAGVNAIGVAYEYKGPFAYVVLGFGSGR